MLHNNNIRHRIPAAVIVLTVVLSTVSSLDVRWNWSGDHGDIGYFRYQLNGEDEDGWTVVDGSVMQAVTPDICPEEENTFHLQSSYDGETWSSYAPVTRSPDSAEDGRIGITDGRKFGIRTAFSPYTLAIIDFFRGHDIEGAGYLTLSSYGASAEAELFFDICRNFSVHIGSGYSAVFKDRTVMPGAFDIHYLDIVFGSDIVIPVTEKARICFGLNVGGLLHFNAGSWNSSPVAGARVHGEYDLGKHLSLGAMTECSLAYLGNEDRLMKSMTWLLEPVALTVTCRF